MNNDKTMLTEYEVADMLGISALTLRRWRFSRLHLPFHKIGGSIVRYKRSDVEKFIEENVVWTGTK